MERLVSAQNAQGLVLMLAKVRLLRFHSGAHLEIVISLENGDTIERSLELSSALGGVFLVLVGARAIVVNTVVEHLLVWVDLIIKFESTWFKGKSQ